MSDIREPESPIHPHQHKLVRSLGLLDVVMIGIAGMIGGSLLNNDNIFSLLVYYFSAPKN